MNSNVLGLRNGILTKPNSDNNNFYINFCFDRRYNSNLLYNTDLSYNPFTQTLTAPNFSGNITANKVVITDNNDNTNYKLVFTDGNNNLLDNAGLLYQPYFRLLKVEANNSHTYQLLLQNTSQSAGIQIKGQPITSQNEANITHYQDVLKIQNTGTDTEIQQVGSGTINIYNGVGSLLLNSSGNIIISGDIDCNGLLTGGITCGSILMTGNITGVGTNTLSNYSSITATSFIGNGSQLTSLTTANLNGLIQNNQLLNPSIYIGSTLINLGDTANNLSGLTTVTANNFIGVADSSTDIYISQKQLFSMGQYDYLFFTDLTDVGGLDPYGKARYYAGLYYDGFNATLNSANLQLNYGYLTIDGDVNGGVNIDPTIFFKQLGADKYKIGYSSSNTYLFFTDTANTRDLLRLLDNGNVVINPSSGNIGIGDISPESKLHILGIKVNTPTIRGIHLGEDSLNGNQSIEMANDSGQFCYIDFTKINNDLKYRIIADVVNESITFQPSTWQNYVKFNSSGNLGVGVDATEKIVSSGTVRALGGTVSNQPSITLSYATNTGQIEARGINGSTQANLALYVATEAFQSSNVVYIQGGTGNMGIGTTNPTSALDISKGANTRANIEGYNVYWNSNHSTGSTTGSVFYGCQYNGTFIGYIYQATTNSIAIQYSSDYRLKENIVEMPNMLDKINKLRPIQFNYLEDKQDSLGFIAHEFKEIFPNNAIVRGEKDGMMCICSNCHTPSNFCECDEDSGCCEMKPDYQGIDYSLLTPILVKGIQELSVENETLKDRIHTLEENQKKIIQKLNELTNPDGWFQNNI